MKRRTFVAAVAALAAPLPAAAEAPALLGVDMASLPSTASISMVAGGKVLGTLTLTIDCEDLRAAAAAVQRAIDRFPSMREPLAAYLMPGGNIRNGLIECTSRMGSISMALSDDGRAAIAAASRGDAAALRMLDALHG